MRNQVICLETLTNTSYRRVEYFLLKFCTGILINDVYKSVFGIFLDLELFPKIKKRLVKLMYLILEHLSHISSHSFTPISNTSIFNKVGLRAAKTDNLLILYSLLCKSYISWINLKKWQKRSNLFFKVYIIGRRTVSKTRINE